MGLVERVGDDVQRGERPRAESALEHHEAHLGDGGVGEGAFDARLREHDERGEHGGGEADERDREQRGRHGVHQRAEADEQVTAAVDDAGVHERGDGRRRLHRVGQPAMKRHQRGFEHGAEREQQRHRGGGMRPRERRRAGRGQLREHRAEIERAKGAPAAHAGTNEAEIAEAAGEKFFTRGDLRGRPLRVEAQELVQAEACRDPGNKQHDEMAGADHQQDGREGFGEPGEEATLPRIAVEVIHCVAGDDPAEEGNEDEHRDGERIDAQAPT